MREKTRNTMRSAEEKEQIVLESFQNGCIQTAQKYDIYSEFPATYMPTARGSPQSWRHWQTGRSAASEATSAMNLSSPSHQYLSSDC